MNTQIPIFDAHCAKPSRVATSVERMVGGFDVKKFVENFEVLADTDRSIKRLREMVLGLAVRGSLVPQLPGEGDSDSLVLELAARRSKLSSTTRVRGDLAEVPPDEQPFMVPPSWRWLRLGHFGGFLGGGTPAKSNTSFWDGTIPWVSPKDMKKPYIDDAEDHISEAAVEGSAVKLIPKRSLLFVVRGMILAHSFPVAMTTKKVTINQDMKALVLAVPDLDEYLLRACWAARARVLQRVERSSHGTCRLESEAVEELPIPVPPLAEQKRIVTKVDELMRLLDDLEAKQAKKRETQARLRTAALDALTLAAGPEEVEAAWKRVGENFGVLFERAESVKELRRSVLGLAIRGSLLGQRAARSSSDQDAFPVPSDWGWKPLRELGATQTGSTPSTKEETFWGGDVQFVTPGDIEEPFVRQAAKTLSRAGAADGRVVPAESILMVCIGGSLGKVGHTRSPICCNQQINAVTPGAQLIAGFVAIALRSPYFQRQAWSRAGQGTLPIISKSKWEQIPIPVPPIKEQERILAKVDQLMKLCDDLEAKLRQAEEIAAKLVEAVVQELVA